MNPKLQGYAGAVFEAVAAEERARLRRRARSDRAARRSPRPLCAPPSPIPPCPAPARQAIMRDILEGKGLRAAPGGSPPSPSEPCRRPTWSAPWTGCRCGHPGWPRASWSRSSPLSLLRARQRVGGFAKATFEPMSTGELENLEDELFRFARIVESTPALRRALVDRELQREDRQGMVTQLLEGKVQAGTLSPGSLRDRGRPGPRRRGHVGLAGRADGAGPRLAHCPGAGGRPCRGRRSRRTFPRRWPDSRVHPSSCRSSSTRGFSAAQSLRSATSKWTPRRVVG